MSTTDTASAAATPAPARPSKGIFWLASYPKSGNTWLRIFLYHIMRQQLGLPREPDEINKLDRSSGYEAKLLGLFQHFLGKPVSESSQLDIMRVRANVQRAIADRMPSVALVKTHNLRGDAWGIPTINPDVTVGAIYVVRDPRDVSISLARQMGSTVDHAIEVMRTKAFSTKPSTESAFEIWGSWSQHVASWAVSEDRSVLAVRYEDMLEKPTETFTAILKHLRQQVPPEQITEAIEISSFDKLKRLEETIGFRERAPNGEAFFATGKAGNWRTVLTPKQADAIENEHAKWMEFYHYLT
jgi:hypothetical protein